MSSVHICDSELPYSFTQWRNLSNRVTFDDQSVSIWKSISIPHVRYIALAIRVPPFPYWLTSG